MAALAAATSRVRLGQMCTCMGYRNPVYLAKVAATSTSSPAAGSRWASAPGWYEHEWLAYGYGFPSAGERIARLAEGVADLAADLWTDGHRDPARQALPGRRRDLPAAPLQGTRARSAQRHPAVDRRRRGEEDAADRRASTPTTPTSTARSRASGTSREVLRGHCADIGRDFDEIVRSANYNVVIGRDEAEVQDRLAWIRDHYLGRSVRAGRGRADAGSCRTGPLVGTPEQIVEQLAGAARTPGMTYAIANFAEAAYDTSGIHLFENQVIPALQVALPAGNIRQVSTATLPSTCTSSPRTTRRSARPSARSPRTRSPRTRPRSTRRPSSRRRRTTRCAPRTSTRRTSPRSTTGSAPTRSRPAS